MLAANVRQVPVMRFRRLIEQTDIDEYVRAQSQELRVVTSHRQRPIATRNRLARTAKISQEHGLTDQCRMMLRIGFKRAVEIRQGVRGPAETLQYLGAAVVGIRENGPQCDCTIESFDGLLIQSKSAKGAPAAMVSRCDIRLQRDRSIEGRHRLPMGPQSR